MITLKRRSLPSLVSVVTVVIASPLANVESYGAGSEPDDGSRPKAPEGQLQANDMWERNQPFLASFIRRFFSRSSNTSSHAATSAIDGQSAAWSSQPSGCTPMRL